jgi:hypothetical protein
MWAGEGMYPEDVNSTITEPKHDNSKTPKHRRNKVEEKTWKSKELFSKLFPHTIIVLF